MSGHRTLIGIDPGVHTGFAIARDGLLAAVSSMSAVAAETEVRRLAELDGDKLLVVFEDARLRTWFGSKGREALQGAGSIKRDCHRWEEWLTAHGIKFTAVAPARVATKLSAEQFQLATGWIGRTNEHGRDAAMLIWPLRTSTRGERHAPAAQG